MFRGAAARDGQAAAPRSPRQVANTPQASGVQGLRLLRAPIIHFSGLHVLGWTYGGSKGRQRPGLSEHEGNGDVRSQVLLVTP